MLLVDVYFSLISFSVYYWVFQTYYSNLFFFALLLRWIKLPVPLWLFFFININSICWKFVKVLLILLLLNCSKLVFVYETLFFSIFTSNILFLSLAFTINQYQLLFNPIKVYYTTLKRLLRLRLSVESESFLIAWCPICASILLSSPASVWSFGQWPNVVEVDANFSKITFSTRLLLSSCSLWCWSIPRRHRILVRNFPCVSELLLLILDSRKLNQ